MKTFLEYVAEKDPAIIEDLIWQMLNIPKPNPSVVSKWKRRRIGDLGTDAIHKDKGELLSTVPALVDILQDFDKLDQFKSLLGDLENQTVTDLLQTAISSDNPNKPPIPMTNKTLGDTPLDSLDGPEED